MIWIATGMLGGASGCTSSFYAAATASGDDLYATHDRVLIARQEKAEAEAKRAEAEARRAEWEARLAEARARAASGDYDDYDEGNGYRAVLADDYQSAYARRLRGFQSLSYNLPASYYDLYFSPTYSYVSAYDPLNYNIIVMGDEIWVEPKYVTSMFGTWGMPSVSFGLYGGSFRSGWYFGWGWPSYWWNDPWYNGGWGWPGYYPYWGWGWDPWYPHYHPGGWYPHPDYGSGSNFRPNRGNRFTHSSSPYRSPDGNNNFRGSGISGSGSGYRSGSNYRVGSGTAGSGYRPSTGTGSGYRPSTGAGGNYRGTNGNPSNYRRGTTPSGNRNEGYRNDNTYRNSDRSNTNTNYNNSNYRSNTTNSGGYRSSGGSSSGFRSGGGSGGSGARSGGGSNYRR